VLCVLLWGVWGFLSKLLSDAVGAIEGQILYTFGMLPVVLAAAWTVGRRGLIASSRGMVYALLNGSLSAAGTLAFLAALAAGPVSLVSPMTSVYPIVTVCMAVVLLRERISVLQACGGLAAIAGLVLLS